MAWTQRGHAAPARNGLARGRGLSEHAASQRKVSTSTHNQALSALLFLYREVLAIDLPWMDKIDRPACKRRIPRVLTRDEMAGVLAHMVGETALLARLLDEARGPC